jgi:hypothetical protein
MRVIVVQLGAAQDNNSGKEDPWTLHPPAATAVKLPRLVRALSRTADLLERIGSRTGWGFSRHVTRGATQIITVDAS